MNKRLNISEALKGAQSPIAGYPWRFTCGCCGYEDFGSGSYPLAGACTKCGSRVEAEENPEYVRPSMMTLQSAS